MSFWDALAWFVIAGVLLRVVALEWQLRVAETPTALMLMAYLQYTGYARRAQVKALAVGIIAVLWLVFG